MNKSVNKKGVLCLFLLLLCVLCACGKEDLSNEPLEDSQSAEVSVGESASSGENESSLPSADLPVPSTDGSESDACAHEVVTDPAVEATCKKTGLSEGSHCGKCKTVLVAQKILPVTGHKAVTDKAIAPTCSKMGLTAGSHCAYCAEILRWQEPVPMPYHTFKDGACTACGIAVHSQGLYFTLNADGSGYVFDGVGDCTDEIVVIPALYDGLPVKEIYSFYSEYAHTVVIPDSVTTIRSRAFYKSAAIREIVVGAGVTEIKDLTFADCTALERIVFKGKISYFGKDCFADSKAIKEVHIADIASWCTTTFSASAGYPLQYGGGTLYHNGAPIVDLVIPEGVTEIGDKCFENCTSVRSLTLPQSLTVIGDQAFYGCTALEQVTIPGNVKTVKATAFGKCTSLKDVIVEQGVEEIYMYTFNACTALESVALPDSLDVIANSLFAGCTSLKSVEMGKGAKAIRNYAFKGCTALEHIVIADGVSTVEKYAFDGCTELKSVTFGKGVTVIEEYAFEGCTSLTNAILPAGITTMGFSVFEGVEGQTLFAEAESLPAGWNTGWAGKNSAATVFWGGEWTLVDGVPAPK